MTSGMERVGIQVEVWVVCFDVRTKGCAGAGRPVRNKAKGRWSEAKVVVMLCAKGCKDERVGPRDVLMRTDLYPKSGRSKGRPVAETRVSKRSLK